MGAARLACGCPYWSPFSRRPCLVDGGAAPATGAALAGRTLRGRPFCRVAPDNGRSMGVGRCWLMRHWVLRISGDTPSSSGPFQAQGRCVGCHGSCVSGVSGASISLLRCDILPASSSSFSVCL